MYIFLKNDFSHNVSIYVTKRRKFQRKDKANTAIHQYSYFVQMFLKSNTFKRMEGLTKVLTGKENQIITNNLHIKGLGVDELVSHANMVKVTSQLHNGSLLR
jgi:hypothetical protein